MSDIAHDSPTVQSSLQILQGVINRMAANSAASKTWCIALVSAIVVVIAGKNNPSYVWIALIPIVLFLFLDAYYLALERNFRDQYKKFVKKLHAGSVTVDDLFLVTPGNKLVVSIFWSFFSLSVWPFYGLLIAMILVFRFWFLNEPPAATPS